MKKVLKILLLEDSPTDAELVQIYLEELDSKLIYKVTHKKQEYLDLLYSFRPDVIIADHSLPGFDGLKALHLLREQNDHTPFIFFTGTLGEENAVRAIKSGASDFLIKSNLHQLPAAVMKALREREVLRKQKAFEKQLIAINSLNSALLHHNEWEQSLNEAFSVIGSTLGVDRVYYFENSEDEKGRQFTSQKLEWNRKSISAQIDNSEMQNLPFEEIAELMDVLKRGETFQTVVRDMPQTSLKDILINQDVQSILVLPIFVSNRLYGFLGFDDCRHQRLWSEDEHEFLDSLTSTLSNVIEKRNLLQDLSHNESALRKAQNIAKLGYWRRRLDSEVVEWSEECYQIFGYTRQNFLPTLENFKKVFHPEDRPQIAQKAPKLNDEEEEQVECRIITASAEVRWVILRLNFVLDPKKRPCIIEGTIQDITERKVNEEQLRQSKERFELAIKASTELIWDWNHQSNEIWRSLTYESSLSYKSRDQVDKNNSWVSKIHPEDLDEVWNYINACLRDKDTHHWEKEYRILKPDGAVAYVVDRAYIVRDDAGKPLRSVGACLDVTQSREQLREIQSRNEALREIAQLQSHEVRAPLARIMGLVNLMEDCSNYDLSGEELNKMIVESAHELDEVIRDIVKQTESANMR